jgi:hypothetical protein
MTSKDWKPTACILCECNCGLEVELGGEGGRHLVRLRGDKRHPISRAYACEKAHRLDYYQHGPDRVTSPLRRREDGTFEPIDWDTAIREVAARLGRRARCVRRGFDFPLRRGRAGQSSAGRLLDGDAARAWLAISFERPRPREDRRVLGEGRSSSRSSFLPPCGLAMSRCPTAWASILARMARSEVSPRTSSPPSKTVTPSSARHGTSTFPLGSRSRVNGPLTRRPTSAGPLVAAFIAVISSSRRQ